MVHHYKTTFHHCTFSFITAHFVHQCTLKQALLLPSMLHLAVFMALTFPLSVELLGVLGRSSCLLFSFLALSTLVKILDDDSDEHIEHKETDEKQKRYEVDETPFIVIHLRLKHQLKRLIRALSDCVMCS